MNIIKMMQHNLSETSIAILSMLQLGDELNANSMSHLSQIVHYTHHYIHHNTPYSHTSDFSSQALSQSYKIAPVHNINLCKL